jgi:tRNA modification GTPase
MADTIFALSSGAPPAAIAIMRVSGPLAFAAGEALAGPLPEPRIAVLRALRDPESGGLLDRALLLVFPGAASATGEDLIELHCHGGRAVIDAVEATLARQPGLRRAEPGEFTRRALLAGKIDLSEAEGLGDLLTAETEAQRRAAIESAEGAVSHLADAWRTRLLAIAAHVESELDFSDEDDVHPASPDAIGKECADLADALERVLDEPPVERLRDGIRVTLAGPPNSGKSTLLNALVERDAAIVSAIAGTTRDRIEAPVQRAGIAYLLSDTAGLAEHSDDPIERIGIARSEEAIASADIVVWLGDASPPRRDAIWVHARCDRPERAVVPADRDCALSAITGHGLDQLWRLLGSRAAGLLPKLDRVALNRRQRDCVAQAAAALRRAQVERDGLLVAEELRLARLALDRLVGRADVEAVLDTLFARFCIGK